MIITRSPLRITLGGGGTDLPSYYSECGGFVISAAIDKYVYITASKPFFNKYYLKYSKIEEVVDPKDIQHSIVRETIELLKIPPVEIVSLADVPSGTGLGSSGSFTTALLKALIAYKREVIATDKLASLACDIEIYHLNKPIGKQDQFIAAYGGIITLNFLKNGGIEVSPLNISQDTIFDLEQNLLLFFTTGIREAGDLLQEQNVRTKQGDSAMLDNLNHIKSLAYHSGMCLESGDTVTFGKIMNEHWEFKKSRSKNMSSPEIDSLYNMALNNGAVGGKLVGAGGGGFLMFYASDPKRLRKAFTNLGLGELHFHFDFEGSKIILS